MHRRHSHALTPILIAWLAAGLGTDGWAAPPGTTRVEEDWELVVIDPTLIEAGPQVTTTMAPEPDPARTLMILNLNFREEPFLPGGLQVGCWYDDLLVASGESERTWPLFLNNETIRWTQRLSVAENVLTYQIANGQSSSWGSFGANGRLAMAVTTHVTNLESYTPTFSAENSRVGWLPHRVQRMRLLRVRYYQGDVLLETDETVRPVDLRW